MPVLTIDLTLPAHAAPASQDARWPALLALLTLAALGGWYGRGVHELWDRRGIGAVVSRWRVAAFGTGLAVLAVAESPAAHAAADESFVAHMAQHMVFLMVAGPLLAAGAAGVPLAVAAPVALRRAVGRLRVSALAGWARQPTRRAVFAGLVLTALIWLWHLPGPYLFAVDHSAAHAAEHACLLGAAWLTWSCVLGRHRLSPPAGALLVFVTSMPATALGVVLALVPTPLYPDAVLAPHGGDPLTAQQVAGVVMWAPMEAGVVVTAVVVFLGWLARLDRRLPAGRAVPAPDAVVPDASKAAMR